MITNILAKNEHKQCSNLSLYYLFFFAYIYVLTNRVIPIFIKKYS